MMDLSRAIAEVQQAAQADTTGTGQRHVDLLESIRRLNLAAETPAETLMRMRFQVSHCTPPGKVFFIRLALEGGFLEAVGAGRGQTVTAAEVAQKTGFDELLIGTSQRKISNEG